MVINMNINVPKKKSDIFDKELQNISDQNIRALVKDVLDHVPDYFFNIPASSSGRYHPQYALEFGGLVRHVKACLIIAEEMFRMNDDFSDIERDIVRAALLMHDCIKKGIPEGAHTVHQHPLLVREIIYKTTAKLNMAINTSALERIAQCIESHMGRWTTKKTSSVVLPVPVGELAKFVHMCDYLASRKCLEVIM